MTSENPHKQVSYGAEFMAVPIDAVPSGHRLDFDLYILRNGNHVLFARAGSTFDAEKMRRMQCNDITTFYTCLGDGEAPQLYARRADPAPHRYLESNLSRILHDDRVDMGTKSKVFYSVATHLVKDVLEDPRSGTTVKRAKEAVRSLVELILTQKGAFFNLLNITSHDYYTYTHSVNVCTLSIGLARRLGFKSQTEFLALGVGALLHDVGKCTIDLSILNKPTKLSEDEWKVMQTHPLSGSRMVAPSPKMPSPPGEPRAESATITMAFPSISSDSVLVIEQHHEACNGKGYPHGLTYKEIHLYAKIVKITDIYDALTTNRCYQKAFTPFQAIKIMHEAHSQTSDQGIFREFILLLGYGTRR